MQRVHIKNLEDTMYYGKVPVFIYKINYPYFTTTCSAEAARDINNYYALNAKETENYCRTVLYPQAVEDKKYIQAGRPFNSYTLIAKYTVTYNAGCIVSLYTDTYTYMGGAHGETKRTSDSWNFITGKRIQLEDIHPLTPESIAMLHTSMKQQIAERLVISPGSYFDNYADLLKASFNAQSFYLLPYRFVIYYQQYDIAPYSSGLPEFTFPRPPL